MAGDLIDPPLRQALRIAALALLPCVCTPTQALGPAAPFTPPAAGGAQAAAATAASAPSPEITGIAGVRLGAPPQALIDGRWHRPGELVRGARLSAITRQGATLQHPDGRSERLLLWPSTAAQATAPEPARPR